MGAALPTQLPYVPFGSVGNVAKPQRFATDEFGQPEPYARCPMPSYSTTLGWHHLKHATSFSLRKLLLVSARKEIMI